MIPHTELREYLGFPPEKDDELDALRATVIAQWESATGRLWNARTGYVQRWECDGTNPRSLYLDLWPTTSIASVETLRLTSGETAETLTVSDYLLVAPNQLVRLDGAWWEDLVTITCSGGTSNAADDIKRALMVQARFLHERMESGKIITRSQNFEGGAGVFERADFHPLFLATAQPHRRLI